MRTFRLVLTTSKARVKLNASFRVWGWVPAGAGGLVGRVGLGCWLAKPFHQVKGETVTKATGGRNFPFSSFLAEPRFVWQFPRNLISPHNGLRRFQEPPHRWCAWLPNHRPTTAVTTWSQELPNVPRRPSSDLPTQPGNHRLSS